MGVCGGGVGGDDRSGFRVATLWVKVSNTLRVGPTAYFMY